MGRRESMSTHHVPESTLVGERHTIRIRFVSNTLGRLEKWDIGLGVAPSQRRQAADHSRCRKNTERTFRLVTDVLRTSGVAPEPVEAAGEWRVHGFVTREDGHIARMDPEPTSAEA